MKCSLQGSQSSRRYEMHFAWDSPYWFLKGSHRSLHLLTVEQWTIVFPLAMTSFQASVNGNFLSLFAQIFLLICQTQSTWGTPGKQFPVHWSMPLLCQLLSRQAVSRWQRSTFELIKRPYVVTNLFSWDKDHSIGIGLVQWVHSNNMKKWHTIPVRFICAVNHKHRMVFIDQFFWCNVTDIEMAYMTCLVLLELWCYFSPEPSSSIEAYNDVRPAR